MVKVTVRDHLTGETHTYTGYEGDRVKKKLDGFFEEEGEEICILCLLEGKNEPAIRNSSKASGGPTRSLCQKHYIEENK